MAYRQRRSPNRVREALVSIPLAAAVAIFLMMLTYGYFHQEIHDIFDTPVAIDNDTDSDEPDRADPDDDPTAEFLQSLDIAARLQRDGATDGAHAYYQRLLENFNLLSLDQQAILLADAGLFYRETDLLPLSKIESMMLSAIFAVRQLPGQSSRLEPLHRSLEIQYVNQRRFAEAAEQTRQLLEVYPQIYPDPDKQHALIQPTTMRLANHLLAAGNKNGAIAAYEQVKALMRAQNMTTASIQRLIDNIHLDKNERSTSSHLRLVTPQPRPEPDELDTESLEALATKVKPEGITLEHVDSAEGSLLLKGQAPDNQTIAAYLREFQNRGARPELVSVKRSSREGNTVSEFYIRVEPR